MSLLAPILAYVSACLVLATFWMRPPSRLRQAAIVSSVAFLIYGVVARDWTIAGLYVLLIPLNVWRLHEIQTLTKKVENAIAGDLSMDWLRPFMNHRKFHAGEVIFRKGDAQTDVYYIVSGTVRLPEIDVNLDPGQLIGEMAIFSPNLQRSLSAVCVGEVEMLCIPNEDVLKLYYQNPEFGLFLVRLITRRLLHDTDLLGRMMDERTAQLEKLRSSTGVDEATGIANRRAFDARLKMEWARAVRSPEPLSLLVIQLEDRHDRYWTDEMLTQIVVTMLGCASRATDFLARHEEEFVAILPGTTLAGAHAIAEELRSSIEKLDVPAAKIWSGDVRVRTGVASCTPEAAAAPETLLNAAYEDLHSNTAAFEVAPSQNVLLKLVQPTFWQGGPMAG